MEVPPHGWFIRENPIEMDDLGVPLCQETSIYNCRLGQIRTILAPQALLQHDGVLPVLGCQPTQQNLDARRKGAIYFTPLARIQTWQAGKYPMKNGKILGNL